MPRAKTTKPPTIADSNVSTPVFYFGRVGGAPAPTENSFAIEKGNVAAGFYANGIVRFLTGNNIGGEAQITSNTDKVFTLATDLPFPLSLVDEFIVIPSLGANVSQIGGQAVPGSPITRKGATYPSTQAFQAIGGSDGNSAQPWHVQDNGAGLVGPAQNLANSSTTPLTANEVLDLSFGATQNSLMLTGYAKSDVAGTLSIQQGVDDATWPLTSTTIAVPAGGVGVPFRVVCTLGYTRAVYTNGATAQTTFQLYGYYSSLDGSSSQRAIDCVEIQTLPTLAIDTDFAVFAAPWTGTATVLLSLSTTSVVNLYAYIGGSSTETALGSLGSVSASTVNQPPLTFPVSAGTKYALQVATEQVTPIVFHIKGVPD